MQLARSRGATVVGTASQRNHDYLRSLGALPTTYGPGLADRLHELGVKHVDAVLDAAWVPDPSAEGFHADAANPRVCERAFDDVSAV